MSEFRCQFSAANTSKQVRLYSTVALPGGAGTLDELFEIWTWALLGLHGKPCGLLDADHYYAGLIGFLDHATAQGFLAREHRTLLRIASDAEELLERLAE